MKNCHLLVDSSLWSLEQKSLEELYVIDEELSALIAEKEYLQDEREELEDNGD